MKNLSKVLALVLVVAMLFSFAISANATLSYSDNASINPNYQEAVDLLSALDVLNGYKDGTFKPTGSITRAEFAVMVSYMVANKWSETPLYDDIYKLGKDYAPLCTFADTKNHWGAGYVAFCAGNGYISGRDANTFDPDATITAAEITVILLRVMGYDAVIEDFGTTAGTVKGYNLQITARNAGVLNGLENVGFFTPATREVAAQLMFNALCASVVNYGDQFSLLITNKDGTVATVRPNSKLTVTNTPLYDYCFKTAHLHTVDVLVGGRTGYEWHANPSARISTTGVYPESDTCLVLTGVYFNNSIYRSYKAGTPYADIAKDLGITNRTTAVATEVFVNGKLVGGSDFKGEVPADSAIMAAAKADGLAMGTQQIYNNSVSGDFRALPLNCRLDVVKNADRNPAMISYSFLYYYEFVATVGAAKQITLKTSPLYGMYEYPITVYYDYDTVAEGTGKNIETGYIYRPAADAFSRAAYYLVEPNEAATNLQLLSIKEAKTANPVHISYGTDKVFQKNVATDPKNDSGVVVDSANNTYAVSRYAHDFRALPAGAGNMMLIFATEGAVIGFAPARFGASTDTYGFLYVESLEFSVYATAGSALINPTQYTRSAQAKALVYFPTDKGNNQTTVIDLAINSSRGYPVSIDAACANLESADYTTADGATLTAAQVAAKNDKYVGKDSITLGNETTVAFSDVSNPVYTNATIGNVRVYDKWYDGWYFYAKHENGTYSLYNVESDSVKITKQTPTVTNLVSYGVSYTGTKLNDDSVWDYYTFNTTTKTATVTPTKGFAKIASTNREFNTKQAVQIDLTAGAAYIDTISTFEIVNNNDLGMVFYPGVEHGGHGLYNYDRGQYILNFIVGGGVQSFYCAPKVDYYNLDGVKSDNIFDQETLLKRALDEYNADYICYGLVLNDSGAIAEVHAYKATKDVCTANSKSYITVAANGDVLYASGAGVWSLYDGTATTARPGDTVYYLTDAKGKITNMYVLHAGETAYGGAYGGSIKPIIWYLD